MLVSHPLLSSLFQIENTSLVSSFGRSFGGCNEIALSLDMVIKVTVSSADGALSFAPPALRFFGKPSKLYNLSLETVGQKVAIPPTPQLLARAPSFLPEACLKAK